MLAHELRNPLAPIVTALELIALREPTVAIRERAIIEGQVQQLIRLVNDLLEISRVTQGKIELELEAVELADIVARATDTAAPLVADKSQVLCVHLAPGLRVEGDLVRLAQVVGNLLTNAAKYTPNAGTITVIGERRGEDVVLRIRDTGIGISAEMLPRVFELFAQEARAADRAQGGLGLGLTIAQHLVEMHAGSISAKSEGVGRGSEFEIVLPAWTGGEARAARFPQEREPDRVA
ncbi:MAG: HAMP domain-containing histidine kinase [Deltaproteobacteria bacterium]|nr:HAMP domain-containing histidine kinase [Deltaproteobacteria bacterium]